jgi:hypothetical protein
MAKLGNHKHEKFAQLVARGGKKGESYIACGYKATHAKSHASHLAARPDVRARIEEIQAQSMADFMQGGPSMESLGINAPWLAHAYDTIRAAAMEIGDFKAATKAVECIDSVLDVERSMEAKPDAPQPGRIDITALSDKLGGILDAATAPGTHMPHPTMRALHAAENET